jgi:IS5 family transposase
VDKGYRGHGYEGETLVHVSGERHGRLSRAERKRRRRRAAIEPVIGHTKHDHGMLRCFLKGAEGDAINAILAGCGFNLSKLLRAFRVRILVLILKRLADALSAWQTGLSLAREPRSIPYAAPI